MSTIIGIDLGTSTTEAAVYRNGVPEMIKTFDNSVILPSAVGIDADGNWVVGEKAKAQHLLRPEYTAIEIKRQIGKDQPIPLGNRTYTAVELSAKILEHVKNYASESLGEPIDRAVISVPAYFDDRQRNETIQAGRMAGLQVERILNEPTAAALSYGLDHMEEESHILVYDLGGGTFDVTLLEMFEGVLEVKASSGDNELGGKDFDRKLIDYLLRTVKEKNGVDLSGDLPAMTRIRDAAELCKIALSSQDSYTITLPLVGKKNGKPVSIEETVTASLFEGLCADLLERTHGPVQTVLGDSGLSMQDIDKVILVGGSTRMPMVAKDIEAFLGMKPSRAVDPDYAVAQGASVQAGIIQGVIDPMDGLIITDVIPYSLGIRVSDYEDDHDVMSVIIPRNVTIPVSKTEQYMTYSDYQTAAIIVVYQGESRIASSNHCLGTFKVEGIPPKKAQKEKIDVTFSYDLNGVLHVEAEIVSTHEKASIEIDMGDALEHKAEDPFGADHFDFGDFGDGDFEMPDLSGWKDVEGAEKYRAVIRRAERKLDKMDPSLRNSFGHMLSTAVDMLKAAILAGDWADADEGEKLIKDMFKHLFTD